MTLCHIPQSQFSKPKLEKAIKSQEEPSENWQTFVVKLMPTKIYNNFSLASVKASKACITSDISEREEFLPPKRHMKKKYVSSSEEEGGDSDSLSDFPSQPESKMSDDLLDSTQNKSKGSALFSKKSLRTGTASSIVSSDHSNLVIDSSEIPSSRKDNGSGNGISSGALETTLSRKKHGAGNDFSDSTSSFSEASRKEEDEFQRTILTYLIKIQKLLKDNETEIRNVKLIAENNSAVLGRILDAHKHQDLVENIPSGITQVLNKIPFGNSNDFEEINGLLSTNLALFEDFVNFLARLGGTDYKESVKRMFQRILTDPLMEQYSLYGHKDKQIFRNTKIFEAVIEATHKIDKKCTTKEIELRVSAYLAKSSERMKIKNKKIVTEDGQ